MSNYSAFSELPDLFPTFEAAIEHLQWEPGTDGREPTAVSLFTGLDSEGASGELVSGEPGNAALSQVFLVRVAHEVLGKTFELKYLVEFADTEEDNGNADNEDGVESGPGLEADDSEAHEGAGEGSG